MHFHIPADTLHMYYYEGLEEKKSNIKQNAQLPKMDAGIGLFTTKKYSRRATPCAPSPATGCMPRCRMNVSCWLVAPSMH